MDSTSSRESSNLGVVVGFDGSPHSIEALHWGARAAIRRKTQLTVESAYLFPYTDYLHNIAPAADEDPSRRIAENTLTEARDLLEAADYTGEVEYHPIIGDATHGLVQLSHDAQVLVVGRRGRGNVLGRLLGSVAAALPAHAHCPTVVVYSSDDSDSDTPEPAATQANARDTRPVCVGVDSSDHARRAAIAAAEEAKQLGVQLELVQAQPPFTGTSSVWILDADSEMDRRITEDAMDFLIKEIEFLKQQVPGVEIEPTVLRGTAATAMIECSERAQLTVLGTRGHGGFTSLLLGSVSRTTLSHARGTVMIVPTPKN